jgi:ATP-dependent DNA ligase
MLAVPAGPFDSPDYCFEFKWDGIRALAAVDQGGWRLWGREQADYTARYPELDVLRRLPRGTLVDGELVVLDAGGRPDLPRLLRRHGLADPWRIRQARRWCAVRYVLFDLLYHAGRNLLHEPLVRRRDVLATLYQRFEAADVQFSQGVVSQGRALFAAALAQGHEGIVAKHLASAYRPGWRSAAWRKIKPRPKGTCSPRSNATFQYGPRWLVQRATFFRIEISGTRNERELPDRNQNNRPDGEQCTAVT